MTEPKRPYSRSEYNQALIANALTQPFNVVLLAAVLIAGLLLQAFLPLLAVGLVVYGIAAARTYFDADEENYPAGDYAEAFRIAADAGLGCTVHAGEWAGPESVRAGLGLPVTRIGHGVRAIEDPALVEELAARGIVLECCPTSNVVLKLYPSYEDHPLPRLVDAGVQVTLGSDDPPWFGASIGGEYAVCSERYGFGDDALKDITRTAVRAAFCDEKLKQSLIGRV